MPSAKSTNPAPRKRTRKRKRRAVSVSSSSSSSQPSSSSEEESSSDTIRKVPVTPKPAVSSESESDSDSDTSSIVTPSKDGLTLSQKPNKVHRSPSPSPPPVEIPSFLPPRRDVSAEEKEKDLKDKFRKFWMSSVADGFRDDLEELRKVRVQGAWQAVVINSKIARSLTSGREDWRCWLIP